MKTSYKIRTSLIVSSLILMGSVAVSCNKETTTSEDEIYVTSSTVAINSFKLNANKNVAPSLDSVFFSIDLNNAVIFNADSLPKGADVSKLVPVITFASSMSKAEIAVLGEQGDTIKKVNYLTTTTDSIDFSKKVVLNVTSYDGLNSLEYRLKVNVHQLDPDSIGWEKLEVAQIPSRLDTPVDSKCVVQGGVPVSLVKEADGSFTLSKATDIFSNEWTSSEISLPFTPVMESLTASDSYFYILSDDDTLYSSLDGSSWTALASGSTPNGTTPHSPMGLRMCRGLSRATSLSQGVLRSSLSKTNGLKNRQGSSWVECSETALSQIRHGATTASRGQH